PIARAATTVTIDGGGYGHGIGMSQYGAYGRAVNGVSASNILEHYYTGASVATGSLPGRLRVGMLQGRESISFTSETFEGGQGLMKFKLPGQRAIASGASGTTWRVEPSSTGGIRLFKNGDRVASEGRTVFGDTDTPMLAIYEKFATMIRVAQKEHGYPYGYMEIGTYSSASCANGFCLRLVLVIPMQKYLYGLGEVPSSWPGAALRAQAIAGRTYAFEKVTRLGQHNAPCDCAVYDTVIDQAYIGDSKRTGSAEYWIKWKSAVDATDGKVILYEGRPIQALYSSSSGGHTEHNENVWGGTPVPYLRGVPDEADAVEANPNHTWQVSMTWEQFSTKLERYYNSRQGLHFGKLVDYKLVQPFGVSGRVTVVKAPDTGGVRIEGTDAVIRVSGWSTRSALGIKDTLYRVRISYDVGSRFEDKYRSLDGAPGTPTGISYPVPKRARTPLGRAQDFTRGRMTYRYATEKATWQRGPVLEKYDKLGRERSVLGMPTSDVWGTRRYRGANYVHGSIYYSERHGAHSVVRSFRVAYWELDGVKGPLGLPIKERRRAKSLPDGGKRQRFARGTIYLNPHLKEAFGLWGPVERRYREMGEATSRCGYPESHLVVDQFGQRARFANGLISWTTHGGIEVEC
ncbi:MAG TPA: SpoIID/LytB domain-containing protein, partial [Actinomycetota bacterium]|nr:SpoIID/LytB domain-containing protein [Actinomycetota bacterium]